MIKNGNRKKRKKIEIDESHSIPNLPTTRRHVTKLDDEDACKCPTKRDSDHYNMNHKKRGKAIIFNHYICYGHSQPRRGTECDVARLEKVLCDILRFEVRVFNDLTYCEIMDVLLNLSQENFCQDDCLAVFVLTHGTLHSLTSADQSYAVDDLWKNFIPVKCPSLAGKPKLFFINSCRGRKFDEGVVFEGKEKKEIEKASEDNDACNSFRAPLYADFLAFYSTMEGYTSLRHPAYGTWFIQSLCEALEDKEIRHWEFKEILTLTTRKTALKCNQYSEKVCQIPTMMSTLLRNIYFFHRKY